MTATHRYLESGIVEVSWINAVTILEIESNIADIVQMMNEKAEATYVEIVDMRECKTIPFDLRNFRRVAYLDPQVKGYVLLQPTHLAKTMANMLLQLTRLPIRMASTWDQALLTARQMLQEQQPVVTKPSTQP
jgi:hypothetical protein